MQNNYVFVELLAWQLDSSTHNYRPQADGASSVAVTVTRPKNSA